MNYTVKEIKAVYDKDFQGNPLISKFKKPYKTSKVVFNEDTEARIVKITHWDNIEPTIGHQYEGEIEKKNYNGKDYCELKIVKPVDSMAMKIERLEFRLAKHDAYIKELRDFLLKKFPSVKLPEVNWDGNTPEQAEVAQQQMTQYKQEQYPEHFPPELHDINLELDALAEESGQ